MAVSIRVLLSLATVTACACAAEVPPPGGRTEALESACIVRGDVDVFDLTLALKYFKWNGTTHDAVGINHVLNDIEDLEAKLATETDPDAIDKLGRRIANGRYLLRYRSMFLNSSGKIAKRKVKNHDPSAVATCDDAGCEAGADEDARFIHHAYRTFTGRDATPAELAAALAVLPDRSASDYDATDDYRDELAAWVEATFTADVCDSDGVVVLDPSWYYGRLAWLALGHGASDPLFDTVEIDGEIIVLGGSCESEMSTAYGRTFFSTEYIAPASDSYRYNLNPDATPSSCPQPL